MVSGNFGLVKVAIRRCHSATKRDPSMLSQWVMKTKHGGEKDSMLGLLAIIVRGPPPSPLKCLYKNQRVTAKLQSGTLFTRTQYGDCDQTRFLSSLGSHKFFYRRNKHENNYKVDYQRLKNIVEITFVSSL